MRADANEQAFEALMRDLKTEVKPRAITLPLGDHTVGQPFHIPPGTRLIWDTGPRRPTWGEWLRRLFLRR